MEEIIAERNYSFLEFWVKYLRTYILFLLNKPIKNRKDLPFLLNILKLNGEGAELGVAWGGFSEILLDNSKLSKLYLIDPWMAQDGPNNDGLSRLTGEENNERYLHVKKTFGDFDGRSELIRMTSEEAAPKIKDDSLDFVYIDADHSYDAIKQDLDLWWPKVKLGGIFSGHDYFDGGPLNFGVKKAVDEFMANTDQKVLIIKQQYPSWYIIKR